MKLNTNFNASNTDIQKLPTVDRRDTVLVCSDSNHSQVGKEDNSDGRNITKAHYIHL